MAAHKKPSIASHTIMVDVETYDLIEKHRTKTESKGEAIKRIMKTHASA